MKHMSKSLQEAVRQLRSWLKENPQGVTMQEIKEFEIVHGAPRGIFASALSHLQITGQVEILPTNPMRYKLVQT